MNFKKILAVILVGATFLTGCGQKAEEAVAYVPDSDKSMVLVEPSTETPTEVSTPIPTSTPEPELTKEEAYHLIQGKSALSLDLEHGTTQDYYSLKLVDPVVGHEDKWIFELSYKTAFGDIEDEVPMVKIGISKSGGRYNCVSYLVDNLGHKTSENSAYAYNGKKLFSNGDGDIKYFLENNLPKMSNEEKQKYLTDLINPYFEENGIKYTVKKTQIYEDYFTVFYDEYLPVSKKTVIKVLAHFRVDDRTGRIELYDDRMKAFVITSEKSTVFLIFEQTMKGINGYKAKEVEGYW